MGAALDSAALLADLGEGLERAAAAPGRTLVSATAAVDVGDPIALAFASRLASDRWFCWEQPDRGFAVQHGQHPPRFRPAAPEGVAGLGGGERFGDHPGHPEGGGVPEVAIRLLLGRPRYCRGGSPQRGGNRIGAGLRGLWEGLRGHGERHE